LYRTKVSEEDHGTLGWTLGGRIGGPKVMGI